MRETGWQGSINWKRFRSTLRTPDIVRRRTSDSGVWIQVHRAPYRVVQGFYLDASLRRQESSTMKMEAKTKEAEASMTAAQKLLNVTGKELNGGSENIWRAEDAWQCHRIIMWESPVGRSWGPMVASCSIIIEELDVVDVWPFTWVLVGFKRFICKEKWM